MGVGERGMQARFLHNAVAQLALSGKQTLFDFAQTLGLAELAKEHGHELIPGADSARMALPAMGIAGALERRGGNELQHLAENAG